GNAVRHGFGQAGLLSDSYIISMISSRETSTSTRIGASVILPPRVVVPDREHEGVGGFVVFPREVESHRHDREHHPDGGCHPPQHAARHRGPLSRSDWPRSTAGTGRRRPPSRT